jgi:hypothetical protein
MDLQLEIEQKCESLRAILAQSVPEIPVILEIAHSLEALYATLIQSKGATLDMETVDGTNAAEDALYFELPTVSAISVDDFPTDLSPDSGEVLSPTQDDTPNQDQSNSGAVLSPINDSLIAESSPPVL